MMKQEQTMHTKKLATLAAGLLLSLATSAAAQQVSSSYKGSQRDPFEKRKFIAKVVKPGPKLIEPPSVESRIQSFKQKKAAAMAAQLPAPKPITAFQLDEIQVKGIFRTPRGWAAMVEAKPIKLSYVVYPGESFYNGMLVAIEEDRLVLRREVRWSDGRRETTVEMKALAPPNAVKDAMTTAAASASGGSTAAPAASGESENDLLKRKPADLSERLSPLSGKPGAVSSNQPERKRRAGVVGQARQKD
jgi:Tfp pilus assembly protein PilP